MFRNVSDVFVLFCMSTGPTWRGTDRPGCKWRGLQDSYVGRCLSRVFSWFGEEASTVVKYYQRKIHVTYIIIYHTYFIYAYIYTYIYIHIWLYNICICIFIYIYNYTYIHDFFVDLIAEETTIHIHIFWHKYYGLFIAFWIQIRSSSFYIVLSIAFCSNELPQPRCGEVPGQAVTLQDMIIMIQNVRSRQWCSRFSCTFYLLHSSESWLVGL